MKLAIYDFDGTYIDVQTLPFLFKLWKETGMNDRAYKKTWGKIMRRYMLHKLHLFGLDKPTFRANAMSLTIDMFQTVEKHALEQFLEKFYQTIKVHVPQVMREQLQKDNEEGYHTVLLSGNFDIILKPFLKEGFKQVIGTTSTENGRLMKSEDVEIIINQRKQDVIRNTFPDADFESSRAYADNHYDLPIFELVGHPIAVNPDKGLLKIAMENDYPIVHT